MRQKKDFLNKTHKRHQSKGKRLINSATKNAIRKNEGTIHKVGKIPATYVTDNAESIKNSYKSKKKVKPFTRTRRKCKNRQFTKYIYISRETTNVGKNRGSISPVIKKIKIKTTRYYYTPELATF